MEKKFETRSNKIDEMNDRATEWANEQKYINQQKVKNSHIIKHINQSVCCVHRWIHRKCCVEYKNVRNTHAYDVSIWNVYRTRVMNYSMASRNRERQSVCVRRKKTSGKGEQRYKKCHVRTQKWLTEVSFFSVVASSFSSPLYSLERHKHSSSSRPSFACYATSNQAIRNVCTPIRERLHSIPLNMCV